MYASPKQFSQVKLITHAQINLKPHVVVSLYTDLRVIVVHFTSGQETVDGSLVGIMAGPYRAFVLELYFLLGGWRETPIFALHILLKVASKLR